MDVIRHSASSWLLDTLLSKLLWYSCLRLSPINYAPPFSTPHLHVPSHHPEHDAQDGVSVPGCLCARAGRGSHNSFLRCYRAFILRHVRARVRFDCRSAGAQVWNALRNFPVHSGHGAGGDTSIVPDIQHRIVTRSAQTPSE